MGAGNLKQVSPTECRCPFDKTSFDLQRKTRGAKCNGRGSPGNGHTSSTNQTGVAMHRNLFQVFKLFHHLAALLIAGSTTDEYDGQGIAIALIIIITIILTMLTIFWPRGDNRGTIIIIINAIIVLIITTIMFDHHNADHILATK